MTITPRWTIIPPLARPRNPRQPCRRVARTIWRSADPAAQPPRANATSGAQPVAPTATATPRATTPQTAGQNRRCGEQLAARLAPRQHRGDRHEEQQDEPERHRQPIEVRRADVDLAILEHLDEEREERSEEDDEGEHGEQHVVGEERRLA